MRSYDFKNQIIGQLTDINAWNKALSKNDIESWSKCEKNLEGNIINQNNDKIGI